MQPPPASTHGGPPASISGGPPASSDTLPPESVPSSLPPVEASRAGGTSPSAPPPEVLLPASTGGMMPPDAAHPLPRTAPPLHCQLPFAHVACASVWHLPSCVVR